MKGEWKPELRSGKTQCAISVFLNWNLWSQFTPPTNFFPTVDA